MQDNQKSGKVTFKSYDQRQQLLFPPSLEEKIPDNHLVRIVNHVVDQVDLRTLEQAYPGGGASCYHPRMMLKVLIYGYCTKTYSCRHIARALEQNIHFMWLSAMQYPDFRTINNFRTGPLKTIIEEVFSYVLTFLLDHGYIRHENYFIDGTKMRADARKYSHVWAKNTRRFKNKTEEKIQGVLEEIDRLNEEEDALYGENPLEEYGRESDLTSEEVNRKAREINDHIKKRYQQGQTSKQTYNKQQTRVKHLQQYGRKLAGYEEQERLLNGRRSYSKTDPDATMMRMKNDELLPGYNVLHSTENQFIVNYSIHQQSNENTAFIDHVQKIPESRLPQTMTGDAIYGSEENYDFLKRHHIGNYLKYTGYYEEKRKTSSRRFFTKDQFDYDPDRDRFICPNGRSLDYQQTTIKRSATGYVNKIKDYRSQDCSNCQLAAQCKTGKNPKRIRFSPGYEAYKQQVRANLNSKEGQWLIRYRGVDVETPFGDIKHNMGYRRFALRGLEKVKTEWGMVSIAHNLRKVAAIAS